MRALILDEIWRMLNKQDGPTSIYGLTAGRREEKRFVIAALVPKEGLKKIGFWLKKGLVMDEIKTSGLTLKPNGKGTAKARYVFYNKTGGKETKKVTVEIIAYKTDFNARNHGIIDPGELQKKRVAIFGLGSVGAKLAIDLTRAGVEQLFLADKDSVEISNLCRCEYNLLDVGRLKTEALRDKILEINPLAQPQIFSDDLLKVEPGELIELIKHMDLVVGATDSPSLQMAINGYSYNVTPAVYPGVYPQGKGGDILFTIPGKTSCLRCFLDSIAKQSDEIEKGQWDYTTNGQLKSEPALIADIQNIVTKSTKICLALLMRDDENSEVGKIIDEKKNILFVGNKKYWLFQYPFQTMWADVKINPECECQTLC